MKKLFCSLILVFISFIELDASVLFNSGNFSVHYSEPTEIDNEAKTPLDDLAFTTIYYKKDGSERIKIKDILATSINGGGLISETFTIEGIDNSQVTLEFIYTATDLSGNESREFTESAIRVDSIPPNPPTGQ